jgi:hypothetical protein
MSLRRLTFSAPLAIVFVAACSFPDYVFDDARFEKQNPGELGGAAGNAQAGSSGKGGESGKGGTAGTGGAGGAAGAEEGGAAGDAGAGGDPGTGGTTAGTGGTTAGTGGTAAGTGGTTAGTGGTTAGTGGTTAGTGGTTAGTGGTTAGTGGTAGKGGSAGTGGSAGAPATACTTNAQCSASEICAEPFQSGSEVYLKCGLRNPDAGKVKAGGVCATDIDCESFVCIVASGATKGSCLGACASAADCSTASVCVPTRLSNNSDISLCTLACKNDASCDATTKRLCVLYDDPNPAVNVVGFACLDPQPGSTDFGQIVPAGGFCKWGIGVGSADGNKCTKPCDTAADCAAPFPACNSVQIDKPVMGKTTVKVCTQ